MREIKFRAWHKENKEFVNISPYGGDYYFNPTTGQLYTVHESLNVTEYIELSQYTGMVDRDGFEIYEGDIIEGDVYGNEVVVWSENKFILEPLGDDCIYWEKSKIIGNKYTNKDMLGEHQR